MSCGLAEAFIYRHYYDLFDKSDAYDGIYVCRKCGATQRWDIGPYEHIGCRKCGGMMNLCVFFAERLRLY